MRIATQSVFSETNKGLENRVLATGFLSPPAARQCSHTHLPACGPMIFLQKGVRALYGATITAALMGSV